MSSLVTAAATIGFFHTILGPDHYLPFVVMARSGQWSSLKTALITLICGVGHVAGSIILGLLGVSLGLALGKLEAFESLRGDLAAWGLILLGSVYTLWGSVYAVRNRSHKHIHNHKGETHDHVHAHVGEHGHIHEVKGKAFFSPWALFVIFVFGPCESLIPLLMYPASEGSMFVLLLVSFVFALTTISTMLVVVLVASYGVQVLPLKKMEPFTHAIAGFTILLCGLSIQFLGL